MTDVRPRILFVDDDAAFRKIMGRELGRMGFDVRSVETAVDLLGTVRAAPTEAVLLDLNLPERPGLDALRELREQEPDVQVVVLTGHGAVAEAVVAMRLGACDFLTKPVRLEVLEQTLRRAVTVARLLAENQRLRRAAAVGERQLPELVSAASRELDRQVVKIAATDAAVLIEGESGVGKELIARQLHVSSQRRDGPFVAINCAAIPDDLVESELFGHEKGAFTGAGSRRGGLFDEADGGTLFLDEIGELPPAAQSTLLRAVQFGEVRPVGSGESHRVDVRIVAATNRDLPARVAEGAFREDLYYRLAVFPLRVAPLRARREDIGALARHFLAREAARAGRPLRLTDDGIARLTELDWPGNVRELENAVVRLAVLAPGLDLDAETIDRVLRDDAGPGTPGSGALPTLRLRDLETLAIAAALRRHGGNKRRAAEELGIALKTLYNKLNRAESGE